MLAHLDLHARGVQTIDVVWSSQFGSGPARVETIFKRFSKQSHRHTARDCSNQSIVDARVCHSIHDQIDLLVLLIDQRDSACAVILRRLWIRQEVQRRIDRIGRITACQWTGDVCKVSVSDRVVP